MFFLIRYKYRPCYLINTMCTIQCLRILDFQKIKLNEYIKVWTLMPLNCLYTAPSYVHTYTYRFWQITLSVRMLWINSFTVSFYLIRNLCFYVKLHRYYYLLIITIIISKCINLFCNYCNLYMIIRYYFILCKLISYISLPKNTNSISFKLCSIGYF